jgi:hypothetical protein
MIRIRMTPSSLPAGKSFKRDAGEKRCEMSVSVSIRGQA